MEKSRETTMSCSNLLASIDMGTNSFRLLIIHFEPTSNKITTVDHISYPVLLGHQSPLISPESQIRAIQGLRKFQSILQSHHISRTRVVATSATREAKNTDNFLNEVKKNLGFDFHVEVLSGVEEARLIYLGVVQFCPIYEKNKKFFIVDIGGGSTEFVMGDKDGIFYAESLKLGRLTLTQEFGDQNLVEMRDYIRGQILESRVFEKVKDLGFEIVIGSSGTIRAIEKAIWLGYGCNEGGDFGFEGKKRRFWWFRRDELKVIVERLNGESESESERKRRDGFFGRRSEFIGAGSVLLDEIFEVFGVSEMQVSGYALGEGVVVDMISEVYPGCDLNGNVRWRSVVRLAMRFNGKDRMRTCAMCAVRAKEMFEGLRKYNKVDENQDTIGFCLDDEDLEYLEAACMLHNIGLYLGKKGHHKRSYSIIMECGQLDGYTLEEIELIALLVKHHRKKFPTLDHTSFQSFSGEKFGILCFILRVSVIVQQCKSLILRGIEFYHSHEGFILALVVDPSSYSEQSIVKDLEKTIRKEIEHFEPVFHQKLLVVTHTQCQEPSARQ